MLRNHFRTFIVVSVAIAIALAGFGIDRIETQQKTIQHQAKVLHSLVVNNQNTLKTQGETTLKSAETRVITVAQRCELTGLILEVLVKDDKRRAPAFQKSLKGCEKQLEEVKEIAAHAKAHKGS